VTNVYEVNVVEYSRRRLSVEPVQVLSNASDSEIEPPTKCLEPEVRCDEVTGKVMLPPSLDTAQNMSQWLELLGDHHSVVSYNIGKSLGSLSDSTVEEQEQIKWLVASKEVRRWLKASGFSLLVLMAETWSNDIYTPILYATGLLTDRLMRTGRFLLLSYFCELCTLEGDVGTYARAIAMLNNLNG